MTDQSMNGAGFCGEPLVTNSDTAIVMKNTRMSVPRNSARYAAGPRSCTDGPPGGSTSGNGRGQCTHRVGQVRARLAAGLAGLAAVAAGCGGSGGHDTRITLALDFTPKAVQSPIYAAARRGFDRDNGVRLRIQPPGSAPDALKLVASGRADMAVLDIHDLGLARERGQDFVGVAALVQGPLAAIIARGRIRRPRDLQGRRVGVSGLPSDVAVLRAVLDGDGGDLRRVKQVTIGFAA